MLPKDQQMASAKKFGFVLWRRFLKENTRYAHLQEELYDYNRFWGAALSYFLFAYILLISFVLYIVFISHTTIFLKGLYLLILLFHVILLSAILKYCGDIVRHNEHLCHSFNSALARFCNCPLTSVQLIKVKQ